MGNTSSVRRSKPAMGYLMGEFNRLKSHGVDGEAVWGCWFKGCTSAAQPSPVTLPQAYTHVEDPVLTLSALQRLATPEEFMLDFKHIGTLWKLDANHDGVVTFEELVAFAEFCNDQKILGDLELSQKLKALFAMEMAADARSENGQYFWVDWMLKLVAQDMTPRPFRMMRLKGTEMDENGRLTFYIHNDAVMNLYNLLKSCQITSHLGMQDFLDLMHQMGEALGLQPLTVKELDEWVNMEVVHHWLKEFIAAYMALYRELGLIT